MESTDQDFAKLPRAEQIRQAEAAAEILRRYKEERFRFYTVASPKHLTFHKSDKPIRIFFGGNRSGKTTAGVVELVYRACLKTNPLTGLPNKQPGRYRIFTEKYRLVESFIIPLLQTWVPKKALKGGSWSDSYDSRNNILRLCNGTIIDILTYESDVAGAASVELDGVWADEEMPERLYAETITRLISRKGKMWLTVTPLYHMTWALRFWNKTDDPNVDVFKVSIHDNPHLPEKEKQAIIANWPEHERKAREEGLFMEFEGLVYKELDAQVHWLNDWQFPSAYAPVVCAVDPHPRKATVVTWACITPHDDVVFFDELEVKGTAHEIVKAIREREGNHKGQTYLRLIDPAANKQISGIGSALTTLREFENAGMSFSLADNNEAGYNVVHEYLQWDKTKPIDSMNRPRCYFTSSVPKTWAGMKGLLWDDYRFGADNRDPKEHVKDLRKDFPDCVRYTLASRPSASFMSSEPIELNYKASF